jgi:hypothetical protein
MKQITKNTILRQGDKTYQPVEVHGVICWIDKTFIEEDDYAINLNTKEIRQYDGVKGMDSYWNKIVAQSQSKLEEVPVISLDSYVEKLMKKWVMNPKMYNFVVQMFKEYENQYTQKDIEEAIRMGRDRIYDSTEILEQINQISVIEVDEQFNIVSYE